MLHVLTATSYVSEGKSCAVRDQGVLSVLLLLLWLGA